MKSIRILAITSLLFGGTFAVNADAQSQYTMDLDVNTCNFNFSGNSSSGRIVGKPPRFNMDGTMEMLLTPGGGPFATGEVNGGLMFTDPARIKAEIPNIFSWLPPLATIYIDDAEYTASTPQFAVDGAGNFATDIVLTPTAGTVTVIPLVGSTEVSNLADYDPTDPTPITGNLSESGGTVSLHSAIDVTFSSDDGMGNWVDLSIDGTLDAYAPTQSGMSLTSGAVVAGSNAIFSVATGQANSATFLAYGLSLGSTPVPPLNVVLDIAAATQVGSMKMTDGLGNCFWNERVPAGTSGVTVYMQACQNSLTSNVLTVTIQ
ncbi:MAG: hypothetical protein HQ519_15670 [Planctomycetes bacterium]|nr:hypothetical protein [Planctomycetota bacterium]